MADGTQSIRRAIQLLKAFDDENPRQDLARLVEVTGLNKTTVFRILAALEAEGLVEKTDRGEYQPGSELIALGGRAARVNNLRFISHSHIETLSYETGETTTLEILRTEGNRTFTLVIDEVLGKHLVGINQYIGTRLPVHATSTGKIILAYSSLEKRETLLTYPLETYTSKTQVDREIFEAELSAIAEDGHSVVMGELEDGLVAIGAPIFNHDNEVVAAISVVGPSVRVGKEQAQKIIEQIKAAAYDISYAIGYRKN